MNVKVLLAFLCCATLASAEEYLTSDLGWKQGQDVTENLTKLLRSETIGAGDELVLVDTYRIRGTHSLPDDFTLSAVKGAGFDVTDATKENGAIFLKPGNRCTIRNLTITYLNTPDPGSEAGAGPKRSTHFFPRVGIQATEISDLTIENCILHGSISHHIKLSECARPKVIGCHIVGGYWSVYLIGGIKDALFKHCLFEKCQGDGIKTGRGRSSSGVKRARIDQCVFQDCGRDGIDTTGGFEDSIVRDCIFRRLFSGIDIKSYYERPEHLTQDCWNKGILIERCTFTDMANCITFSTLDRGLVHSDKHFLTADTAKRYAPHDVDINDCVFERTGASSVRMLLLKGGHTIRYKNARFLGDSVQVVGYSNVFKTFGERSLSKEVSEALNGGVGGTLGPAGPANEPGERSAPFIHGPRPVGDW